MKWITIATTIIVLFFSLGVSGKDLKPRAKIVTNKGDIVIELDKKKAPVTVKNFMEYAQSGFYNETIFHRVIQGFMIQGGGLDKNMKRKKTNKQIKNEADNGLKNLSGTIAMARTNDPHSATSQFFINVKDNDFLNYRSKSRSGWGYCVFGKVVEGMNVVKKIEMVKTTSKSGRGDVPVEAVLIKKVVIVETPKKK